MSLINDAVLASNHFDDVGRRSDVIDGAVLGVRPLQRTLGGFAHEPIDRLGERHGPVAAQQHIGFFRRNQQELRVRLLAAHAVIGGQLLEPQVGEVLRVTVAMEVGGDSGVDAHVFEDLRERRNPVLALVESLNRVAPMPVGRQRLVSRQRRKTVAVREAKDVFERRFRRPVGHHVEQTHALDRAGRGVDPGIVGSRAVVDGMPNAEPQLTASASSGPAVKPDVPHVGRVVARRDVGMRRGKHGQAACVQFGGDSPVTDVRRPPVGAGGHDRLKLSLGVVVSDRGDHLAPSWPDARGRGGESEPSVIEVGRIGLLRRDHRFLVNKPAARIKRVGDAALEDSQFQPLEQHFDTVADAAGFGAYRPESALEPPRSIRMIPGIVEEFVEPGGAAPFACGRHVLRPGIADDGRSIETDHRDQRLVRVQ